MVVIETEEWEVLEEPTDVPAAQEPSELSEADTTATDESSDDDDDDAVVAQAPPAALSMDDAVAWGSAQATAIGAMDKGDWVRLMNRGKDETGTKLAAIAVIAMMLSCSLLAVPATTAASTTTTTTTATTASASTMTSADQTSYCTAEMKELYTSLNTTIDSLQAVSYAALAAKEETAWHLELSKRGSIKAKRKIARVSQKKIQALLRQLERQTHLLEAKDSTIAVLEVQNAALRQQQQRAGQCEQQQQQEPTAAAAEECTLESVVQSAAASGRSRYREFIQQLRDTARKETYSGSRYRSGRRNGGRRRGKKRGCSSGWNANSNCWQ